MFQLLPSSAHVLFACSNGNYIRVLDGITWFPRRLLVNFDQPGHDIASGLFSARTKAAYNQRYVEASHKPRLIQETCG
jgi:hypothetical protein